MIDKGLPPFAWIEPIDGTNYLVVRFDGLFRTMQLSTPPNESDNRRAVRKYAFKPYTSSEHLVAINAAFARLWQDRLEKGN